MGRKQFFECLHCHNVMAGHMWNESTLMEILEDVSQEEEAEYMMKDIEEAMDAPDGDTWFTCPKCYEHVYNDTLEIREVPMEKTPYAHLIYKTNEKAKVLLEESW